MPVLCVEGVNKRYAEARALDDVSLVFPCDRITAIIGRSGCGKSTLLKVCNGLVQPDSGVVRAFDKAIDYQQLPALRRRLGYAVQGTGLFPHLSARQNIILLASTQGWSLRDIEQRLAALLQLAQLDPDQLDKYPHQLSGGQQQRVGLCRAMMLRPDVLLLDEPFAAIDPITRIDIHRQLLEMHSAEPSTVILVTHDMREAMRLADHIVVMDQGRIVVSEASVTLHDRYPGIDADELLHCLMSQTYP